MIDVNDYINIKCPFCGEQAIHVAVCDDEGNYHGLVGCEYESDPWSGLGYMLVHDGWGECILCSEGDCMGGIIFDTPEEALGAMKLRND